MDRYESHKCFEDICKGYLNASEEEKNRLAEILTDEEMTILQIGAGCYRLLTDDAYYKAVKESMGEVIYNECNR